MPNKKVFKEVTIPNWTYFGVERCIIELWIYEDDDNEPVYNAAISIFLDDGNIDVDNPKVISLSTTIYDLDKKQCAIECIKYCVELFGKVSKKTYVIREGEIIEELDIDDEDLMDDFDRLDDEDEDEDDDFMTMKIPKNRTLH